MDCQLTIEITNPLTGLRKIGQLDAISLEPIRQGAMLITRIVVPFEFRGQGLGSQLLKTFCQNADKHSIDLFIEAIPYADSLMTTEQLTEWYKRAGL